MTEPGSSSLLSYRHRAREVALQALYALDLRRLRVLRDARRAPESEARCVPESDGAQSAELAREVFEGVAKHFEIPAAAESFARELVVEVDGRGAELDVILASHADNWRVDRMATVDRNILRIATYELQDTGTPAAVILDEAVELARRYGSDASPSFVNGVLDSVARKIRGGLPE